MAPNDILIRTTKPESGRTDYEVLILLNDDGALPEMERLAAFLGKCLEVFAKSDAAAEYPEAIAFAESLARPKGRILVRH